MRRFLMLAYFYPPMGDGGVFRSLKLSRYLPEHGWLPRVVCGRAEDYWLNDPSLVAQLPEGLDVERVGGLTGQALLGRLRRGKRGAADAAAGAGRRSSGLFRRLRAAGDWFLFPDSYAPWIGPAEAAAERAVAAGDVQLIYSSGPPDSAHVLARRIARRTGLPWVADFRDPWFNLHLKTPPTPLHRALHRRAEARVLREARVVAVTEGWRARYAERCRRPPVLIRNGFDPSDFAGLPPPAPFGGGKLRVLHSGKLSLTRSARPFLEGLATLLAERPRLRRDLEIEFLGARESDNEEAAAALGLGETVRFTDPLPHAESLARQRRADLLLLIKHDDPRYRDLVPGKFYEYVAAGRPIVAVTPAGELEGRMESHGLGWTARPRPERVAEALGRAFDALAAGWRPPSAPPVELTRQYQAAQMAALFDEVAARKGEA